MPKQSPAIQMPLFSYLEVNVPPFPILIAIYLVYMYVNFGIIEIPIIVAVNGTKSLLANLAPIIHVAVPCTFSSKTSTMRYVCD